MNIPKIEFTKDECRNNDHWFVPYNEGNMICKKCGRFAKIGRMYYKRGANYEQEQRH